MDFQVNDKPETQNGNSSFDGDATHSQGVQLGLVACFFYRIRWPVSFMLEQGIHDMHAL